MREIEGHRTRKLKGWIAGAIQIESYMGALIHMSPDFLFHQVMPANGGPPLDRLIDKFVTPEPEFFLRTTRKYSGTRSFDLSTHGRRNGL